MVSSQRFFVSDWSSSYAVSHDLLWSLKTDIIFEQFPVDWLISLCKVIICSNLLTFFYSLFLRICFCFLHLILSQSTDVTASAITSPPKTNCMGEYPCVYWYELRMSWQTDEIYSSIGSSSGLISDFSRMNTRKLSVRTWCILANIEFGCGLYYYCSSSSLFFQIAQIKQCAYWQHCYYSSSSSCGCQSHIFAQFLENSFELASIINTQDVLQTSEDRN